jgi:hypothetical protein
MATVHRRLERTAEPAAARLLYAALPWRSAAEAQLQSAVLAAVQVSLLNSAKARQISIFT